MDYGDESIAVIPLGDIPVVLLRELGKNIQNYLNLKAVVLPPTEIPGNAYDTRRRQYNAANVIKALESMPFQRFPRVIGILNVDLFIPIFTHVLGEAQEGGKFALASMYRLRNAIDGSTLPLSRIQMRLTKVVLHEIAHLFSLVHCLEKNCIMHFSGSLQDLDNTHLRFCKYCSSHLKDSLTHHL